MASGQMYDWSNKRLGKLTVTDQSKTIRKQNGGYERFWLCKCDCGNDTWRKAQYLNKAVTANCGCYTSELKRQARLGFKKYGTRDRKNGFQGTEE